MWLWSRSGLASPWSGLAFPWSGLRSLHTGQVFSLTRTFSERDLLAFSALTGDSNPLHLDPHFAKTTAFSRPLVHGVLVNGLISALLGSNSPGCVLLKQQIRFPAPLFVGEAVSARAEVQRVRLSTAVVSVRVQTADQTEETRVVLEGTITVKIHKKQEIG
uniref:MaoC-like domain-containing protein n=1 Tax=Neogobius melanostomus TaxID=47308 RepID=A0A8C6U0L5_9GOBI